MPVYVDALRTYSHTPLVGYKEWCHMWTDGDLAELHAFAKSIGLQLIWFQPSVLSHYDLTPSKRGLAIRRGAIEGNLRESLLQSARPFWASRPDLKEG